MPKTLLLLLDAPIYSFYVTQRRGNLRKLMIIWNLHNLSPPYRQVASVDVMLLLVSYYIHLPLIWKPQMATKSWIRWNESQKAPTAKDGVAAGRPIGTLDITRVAGTRILCFELYNIKAYTYVCIYIYSWMPSLSLVCIV